MKYEYWFAAIEKLSDQKKILLKQEISTAKEIYYIEEKVLDTCSFLEKAEIQMIQSSKRTWNLEGKYQELKKLRIRLIVYGSEDYPTKLKTIFHPPYALYVKGNLPTKNVPAIAIVGARKCTSYGEKCACEFAEKLTEYGAEIISGLAYGIDGMSQRAAINQNGKTFAVLGSGADVCYPHNHIGLYTDILEHEGGIISEQLPGTKPLGWNFPMRNRIISGLSDVVLVMEAKEKSGSLITADLAMDQGKDVYALPGPVTSPYSQGCNRLIKQGAGVLLSPEELMEDLSVSGRICLSSLPQKKEEKEKVLERTEKLVYSCLDFDSKNADTIAAETELSPLIVINGLISLELKGLVKEISKNNYVKI
ncbi:MAG: DNA-processing protein DprA [Hespellia sp.]|nr:DNA-processing protein DprA [Hespellia sp.]